MKIKQSFSEYQNSFLGSPPHFGPRNYFQVLVNSIIVAIDIRLLSTSS
jgi:hypothetical protein